jgi:folate-binding protein YgfZ
MPENSPLVLALVKARARLIEEAGWQVAAHFGDPAREYQTTCESAAVFDLSHRGRVEASGPDAAIFLHNLCSNEIKRLATGCGCETFFTNAQARVVAHGFVYHLVLQNWPKMGDRRQVHTIDLAPGTAEKLIRHLNQFLISEQVELADVTRAYGHLHLAGPHAQAVLEKALRGDVQGLEDLQDAERTFRSPTSLRDSSMYEAPGQATAMIRIPAVATCHIRRHKTLGLPGYDILAPASRIETVWQYLTAAGARPAGIDTYHALRIEAGTPLYGADIDESNLAPEVGRTAQAISYAKGCFLGQEPIVRIRDLGHVNRTLVGLRIDGIDPVPRGTKVWHDGKEVGHVTSAATCLRLAETVALGYLRGESQKPGTRLDIELSSGRRSAETMPLPFGI